jgi:hypothetical protein
MPKIFSPLVFVFMPFKGVDDVSSVIPVFRASRCIFDDCISEQSTVLRRLHAIPMDINRMRQPQLRQPRAIKDFLPLGDTVATWRS